MTDEKKSPDNKKWYERLDQQRPDLPVNQGWFSNIAAWQAICGNGDPVRAADLAAFLHEGCSFEQLTEAFLAKFSHLNLRAVRASDKDPDDEYSSSFYLHSFDEGAISYDHDGDRGVGLQVVCTNKEVFEQIKQFWKENTTQVQPKGRMYVLVMTQSGPEFVSMGVAGENLTRDNYSDEVLEGYDRIVADLRSKKPAGRVAILSGKPGTGKTTMLKGLMNEVGDCIVTMIPSNLVASLAQPSMIPALINLHKQNGEKPLIFLVEDADEVLATRMGDNMSAVSAVLNLGDGIMGALLDIRLVATTNAKKTDLDAAVTRPGRLSAHVDVGPLSAEKAEQVYRRLHSEAGTTPVEGLFKGGRYTLAEVYQMARDSGWVASKADNVVGFR